METSGMGELSLVKHIRESFFKPVDGLVAGIGDDAAVLKPPDGCLVVTTDALMEGVHFDLTYCSLYQVGYKLVSVNVSDIYAMGARPLYMLLSLSIPPQSAVSTNIEEFLSGMRSALDIYNAALVGGDVTSSRSGLALSATIIGVSEKTPVMRNGAKPGDRVYVTGSLGDSAAGLHALRKLGKVVRIENSETIDDFPLSWNILKPLINRHLMPAVKQLPSTEHISSMMDISDGLAMDLRRLCGESGVGSRIYEKNLPISVEMTALCRYLDLNPLDLCLCGGEDYELLFTSSSCDSVTDAVYIGEIVQGDSVIIVTQNSSETELKDCGYDHFKN
ncbi:MAG: thiamine-phosphate kinase [Nitrospirae bacterium]|nr:thiamine-phosphate kinase [Nitrospirota bacterium]MBF0535120.1 thiamine-phosphate kinase [Nitrospirota bacterium]MBF0615330.1 thiamine-phosphate kinase [Nitrospirota bacterium]